MLNLNLLKESLNKCSIDLSEDELNKLAKFYDLVIETNQKFNLTAITEEKDFINKHLVDSLLSIDLIPKGASLIDIGSGAGFPSVPLAIARQDIKVTALDSTAKKMGFIMDSAKEIGINNIRTIAGRAEDQKSCFNKFEVATARAVSSLNILLELIMPLLKENGIFIAYKADDSEVEGAKNALKTLKASYIGSHSYTLPNGDPRVLLVFKKIGQTPSQYPRQYGTIKNHPL